MQGMVPSPARADPAPHPVPVGQEGPGSAPSPGWTLSRHAHWVVSQPRHAPEASDDGAAQANPDGNKEGTGGGLQVTLDPGPTDLTSPAHTIALRK